MNTTVVNTLQGLKALRPHWEKLEKNALMPMQHYIWAEAAATHLVSPSVLHLMVVEQAGVPIAIAPIVRRGDGLEWLGDFLFEPCDLVYDTPGCDRVLMAAFIALRTRFFLKRIPTQSPLPFALQQYMRIRGVCVVRPDNGWPWIPLDARWEYPENQLQGRRRSDLRRAQRLAEHEGPVTHHFFSPAPSELAGWLDTLFAIEASGWKGLSRTALALDPLRGAIYRHYAAAACEKGILRLSVLKIGERVAAFQMAVECGGRLWLLKIGYDPAFARCSPGLLLLAESLRVAAKQKLLSLEFLGTMEPWIRAWTSLERTCVSVRGYPIGLRSAASLATDVLQSAGHRLKHVRESGE